MKKFGDPVLLREQEWEGRPKAFDVLASVIVHYEKILEQHAAGVGGHLVCLPARLCAMNILCEDRQVDSLVRGNRMYRWL